MRSQKDVELDDKGEYRCRVGSKCRTKSEEVVEKESTAQTPANDAPALDLASEALPAAQPVAELQIKLSLCSIHGVQRNVRFLTDDGNGLLRCSDASLCRSEKNSTSDEPRAPTRCDTCDLCNVDIPVGSNIDEHVKREHSTLLMFCNDLVDKSREFENVPVPSSVSLEFGAVVRQLASECDKGKKVFEHALDSRNQLQVILSKPFPKAQVFMFGSCVASGCWDGVGDVDFTLIDPQGWMAKTWPDDEKSIVQKATRTLRDAGFKYEDLEPLLRTRVPIVKHKVSSPIDFDKLRNRFNRTLVYTIKGELSDAERRDIERLYVRCNWTTKYKLQVEFPDGAEALQHYMRDFDLFLPRQIKYQKAWARFGYRPSIFCIDFDLSTRAHGVRNSWLLRRYMEQDSLIRCGSVYIKHWSKRSGINNSMKGYLTSYAVNIMWIYFLLMKKVAKFVDPHSILPSLDDKSQVTYIPMLPKNHNAKFDQSLGELVAGFFHFYAIEFDWKRDVISVNYPHLLSKEELKWVESNEVKSLIFRERVWYRLCIEDPFEEDLNLGRHVSPIKLNKLKSEFLFGYCSLVQKQPERLMRDRSSQNAEDVCLKFLRRLMIGKKSELVSTVISQLQAADLDSLAAFEVENSTKKLFVTAGYKVEDDSIVLRDNSCFIPETARDIIKEIDEALKSYPLVGFAATPATRKSNLDLVFYLDGEHQRYFLTKKDSLRYSEHFRVIKRAFDDKDEQCTEATIRKKFVDAEIPLDENIFGVAINEVETLLFVEPAVEEATPAVKEPIKQDLSFCFTGNCDGCKKKMLKLWKTTNTKQDNGLYCQECWNAW